MQHGGVGDSGCAVSLWTSKDLQFIPVPLLQGLIVLGEASPPDPAVDDSSRPVRAEVRLEPGAERLVSARVGLTDCSRGFPAPLLGREGSSLKLWGTGMLKPWHWPRGAAPCCDSRWESLILVCSSPHPVLFWG